MITRIRKHSLPLVVLLILAVTLQGCSANAGNKQSANESANKNQEAVKPIQLTPQEEEYYSINGKKPQDVQGKILFWTWDPNFFVMMKNMNQIYPKITFDFVNVSGKDYLMKLQTSLASGGDVPDVLSMEISNVGKFYTMDILEDIGVAPYNIDKNRIIPYLAELSLDKNGKLLSIPNTPAPGGFFYRRDLAKQYFGTDDPKEIGQKLATWDSFIAAGKELKEKSGGKVSLISGVDALYTPIINQNSNPWVKDKKLLVAENFIPSLEMVEKLKSANIDAHLDYDSPAYNASFANGKVLGYMGASWYQSYVIETNDKNGKGNWAVTNTPGEPYNWGGIWWGMYKNSKNKDAVAAWMKFELSSHGAKNKFDTIHFYPVFAPAYDEKYLYQPNTYLNGEDDTSYYLDVMKKMKVRKPEANDAVFSDSFRFYANSMLKNGGDPQEIAKKIEEDLINKVPDYQK
jgi:multiple sugar transport system substrate-binding protein